MFRHQTHPYQTTTLPQQQHQQQHLPAPPAKYPWLENSSAEESQYAEPPRWGARSPDSPVYHAPYPQTPPPNPPPSDAARVPGGCGGHCPGFEYVCYYVLQIVFVVGILTGVSLCIAGSVLRRSNRGGDLGVLVYIGCLAAMVCAVLLGVQCCVRRTNKRRCKQLRSRTAAPPCAPDCIPLDSVPVTPPGHMRPLLHPPAPVADYYARPERQCREIDGVPWWRRQ